MTALEKIGRRVWVDGRQNGMIFQWPGTPIAICGGTEQSSVVLIIIPWQFAILGLPKIDSVPLANSLRSKQRGYK